MARIIVKEGMLHLKPYCITELASLYDVCHRTFAKWLTPFEKEIGEKKGRYYTVAQVQIILDKIGLPAQINLLS
jgi:hypothetical protein